jgi:Ras-related protein Rab-28
MSDSEDESRNKNIKLVLIGDGSSGKTSISTRYSQDQFDRQYNQTLGIDFFMKRITLPGPTHVVLSVHDIGGQTLGGAMLDKYLYGADGVLLVYDITNYSSFENLEDWYQTALKFCQNKKKVYFGLVANKFDLEHLRAVKQDKHNKFVKEKEMSSFNVSAKTGETVIFLIKKFLN